MWDGLLPYSCLSNSFLSPFPTPSLFFVNNRLAVAMNWSLVLTCMMHHNMSITAWKMSKSSFHTILSSWRFLFYFVIYPALMKSFIRLMIFCLSVMYMRILWNYQQPKHVCLTQLAIYLKTSCIKYMYFALLVSFLVQPEVILCGWHDIKNSFFKIFFMIYVFMLKCYKIMKDVI